MKTAALAQSVERRSRKAKVSGSIPEGGSTPYVRRRLNKKMYSIAMRLDSKL